MFERIIEDQARLHPSAPAYADGLATFTYQQMAEDISRCAAWLRTCVIAPGDRVVLHVSSEYRYWVLFFALEAHGAVSLAASTLRPLTVSDIEFLKPAVYFTDQGLAEGSGTRGYFLDPGWASRMRAFRAKAPPARARSGDDPICIVLSSGTTGTAKKVLLSRSMIDARAIHGRSSDLITATSRVLMVLPSHSIGGLLTALSTWVVGAVLIIRPVTVPVQQLLAKVRPSAIAGAPSHFRSLVNELPEDFVADHPIDAMFGGGSLSGAVADAIHRKLRGPIRQSYASTEMGFVARGAYDLSAAEDRPVGFILPDVEVSVRDGAWNPLPHGNVGEIWVRGPHVVDAYLEDPTQTAASFREGWYHPGDLGTVHSDGRLTIHGRTDDLINIEGVKILPTQIESRLLDLGVVDDVAVTSARQSKTEPLKLLIVCVGTQPIEPTVLASAVPRKVSYLIGFVDTIPRNAMGKIDRAALRAQLRLGGVRPRPI